MVRRTRPGPALYAARAKRQSPNSAKSSFRYRAAASVALIGSRRSSIQWVRLRPIMRPVCAINCHNPTARDRE